ncbi:hypothetical protein MGYG_00391 [Nannizzia gypsea CBS 118893]|uniref:F-box domain-containing protein n=1 Tax=Arthroderma gypseum (strain ATCC MYA-4604 / CBS 118893) TaxID=535722 RepID=E5QZI6_ARTGP|nr:hypothetical protein MGYG_00391 [Nannizzia gypsea CBS 118893]EFQ97352.1 hypothetical protein MGYG_00391 [Nannizzia gypsea CBS 118893]
MADPRSPPLALTTLPSEIMQMIGEHLDPRDLRALVRTAKRLCTEFTPNTMKNALSQLGQGLNTAKPETILDWSIYSGHTEMANMLLDILKADKSLPRRNGHSGRRFTRRDCYKSALENSAQKGYLDIVQKILHDSVDLSDPSNDCADALNDAIVSGFPEIYMLLIDAGVRLKMPERHGSLSTRGIRAIHAAACQGRVDLLSLIMAHGCSLSEADIYLGWQPLHFAAFHGQKPAVEFLLNNGVNPAEETKSQETALMTISSKMNSAPHHSTEFKHRDTEFSTGHREIIDLLLSHGLELSKRGSNDRTVLHTASMNGNAELVKYLVSLGADITAQDNYQRTPLHLAICHNHIAVSEILLAAGASVTAKDYRGACAIHFAATAGYPLTAISRLLASKGADPSALDARGQAPIHYAIHYGHFNVVKYFLEITGAESIPEPIHSMTLHGAIVKHDVEMLRYLLNAGVKASSLQPGRYTTSPPLHVSIKHGVEDIIRLLLDHGADPNWQQLFSNDTPIIYAIERESLGAVRLLLEKGADISKCGDLRIGETEEKNIPPLIAAVIAGNLDIAALLLDWDADINIRTEEGCGVLEAVALSKGVSRKQRELIVRLLLDRGVDVSLPNRRGGSIISPFCLMGGSQEPIIKLLVEAGADVKVQDEFGNTVLHDIAHRCNDRSKTFATGLFRYLLDKGADPSLVNQSLLTPIHLACISELDYDLTQLLAAGIDPASRDSRGCTALHYASLGGHILQLSQLIKALKQRTQEDESSNLDTVDPNGPSGNEPASTSSPYVRSILNLQDPNGWTALHLAVLETNLLFENPMGNLSSLYYLYLPYPLPLPFESSKVVQLLLHSGADPSILNDEQQTPLDLAEIKKSPGGVGYEARESNRKRSLRMLEEAGAQRGPGYKPFCGYRTKHKLHEFSS